MSDSYRDQGAERGEVEGQNGATEGQGDGRLDRYIDNLNNTISTFWSDMESCTQYLKNIESFQKTYSCQMAKIEKNNSIKSRLYL